MAIERDLTALLLVLAAYVAVSLWPFGPWRWDLPHGVVNAAARTAEGGVTFVAPGTVTTRVPPAWLASAIAAQRLELRLVARSASAAQHGPARLVSIAPDPYYRNLTIAQQGADLVLRVRADGAAAPSREPDDAADLILPGVFATPAWRELELRLEPGRLRFLVDGVARVDEPAGARPLAGWNPGFPLTIGNEATFDRPWLGAIREATARIDGVAIDLLDAASVEGAPRHYWYPGRPVDAVPFSRFDPEDQVLNLLGYIPLGWILAGVLVRRRGARLRTLAAAALLVTLFSISMELLQFGLPSRSPQTMDVILNSAGGAIGVWLARIWPLPGVARPRAAAKI